MANCLAFNRATTDGAAGRYSGLANGWETASIFPLMLLCRVECWAGPKFDAGSAQKVFFLSDPVCMYLWRHTNPISHQVDVGLCASGCPGAEGESCGGEGVMDVWVTGSKNDGNG